MRRKPTDPRTPKLNKRERGWLTWCLRLGLHCDHMTFASRWWPGEWETITDRRERRVLYGLRLLQKRGLVGFEDGRWFFLPLVDLLMEQGVVPDSYPPWIGRKRRGEAYLHETECPSCMGYGHFADDGEPSIDGRDRKCLDCRGAGKVPATEREMIR